MYTSLEELIRGEKERKVPFWRLVMEEEAREAGVAEDEIFQKMSEMYQAEKDSVRNYDPRLKSASGLSGTDAGKMETWIREGSPLTGEFFGTVMVRALAVAESNACMKRIVAAPTAGSCGVMPAVLTAVQDRYQISDCRMTEAMFVAGGIGEVIAARATLAGAEGGCQAEIGSASAMAAGAVVYLKKVLDRRNPDSDKTEESPAVPAAPEIANAAALALKSLLGLACDPVAGLVEVPCVKRNVLGAVNAVTAADMTLAGIQSRIPPDQVIDAMKSIGHRMDESIRETSLGGLAATPAGKQFAEKLQRKFSTN